MYFLAGLFSAFASLSIALKMAHKRRMSYRVVECPMCHGLTVDTTGEKIAHCGHSECGVLFAAHGGWLFE